MPRMFPFFFWTNLSRLKRFDISFCSLTVMCVFHRCCAEVHPEKERGERVCTHTCVHAGDCLNHFYLDFPTNKDHWEISLGILATISNLSIFLQVPYPKHEWMISSMCCATILHKITIVFYYSSLMLSEEGQRMLLAYCHELIVC